MSKCIGWDIGIKNLAYCILDSKLEDTSITSNNDTTSDTFCFNSKNYTIVSWKDISLVSQLETNMEEAGEVSHINTTMTCSALKEKPKSKETKHKKSKSNKIDETIDNTIDNTVEPSTVCGKSAFYCKEDVTVDTAGIISYSGLCKSHYKKSQTTDTTDTTNTAEPIRCPELTVKKCWALECNAKPLKVLKAHIYKGYCKKHSNEMLKEKTHTAGDFLKINRAKTTSKFDINQLGNALFQELDKIKTTILDASTILLENQPVLKNPTMKSIQMFLYSYYLLRIMDSQTPDSNQDAKKIQCYCASKKLDLIVFLPDLDQKRITEVIDKVTSGYQKNKKMSIMMVETILQNNPKWLSFFKGHPKQDDLADSLLMTLHYFEKNSLMKVKSDDKKKEKKDKKSEKKVDKTKDEIIV
jgi:hypothetical protein